VAILSHDVGSLVYRQSGKSKLIGLKLYNDQPNAQVFNLFIYFFFFFFFFSFFFFFFFFFLWGRRYPTYCTAAYLG
jgi:hypothetical protein